MLQHTQRENEQHSQTLIQPSLEIGKEDDEHEKEANHVADKVMKMSDPDEKKEKMKESPAMLQKMGAEKEADEEKIQKMSESPAIMAKMGEADSSAGGMTASKNVEQGINSSKGNGQSLPADTQKELGGKMNADFSGVKIHTDEKAVHMNEEVSSKAFTHGNDIYFNQGQYNPSSSQGKHLLAHELTHTVQQGGNIKTKIQRVKTSGGEWNTGEYKLTKDGTSRGTNIDLFFQPGDVVNAEQIGLVQTAKAINNNSVTYIGEPTREAHGIKPKDAIVTNSKTNETDEGTHIDQAGYNRNPLYAAEGAPAVDKNLYDTLPAKNPDTNKYDFGHHGWRYIDLNKKLQKENAELIDTPTQPNTEKNSSNTFEVAALAIKGVQKGAYYGSVRWGWKTDTAGNHSLIPLSKVSDGVPSSSFMKSAELWNKGTTSDPAVSSLDLPVVDVYVLISDYVVPAKKIPYANTLLKKGTRVKFINQKPTFFYYDMESAKNVPEKPNIKVVDGTYTNYEFSVPSYYLKDERK